MAELDPAAILRRADELYAHAKLGDDVGFRAPETRPRIVSEQVKAAIRAIVEALNAGEG